MSQISPLMEGHARNTTGRVLSEQSQSATSRPGPAGQNGTVVDQSARPPTSRPRKHWLDYATAFLTLAAAGGAITAAIFTGWQAVTADQGLRASNRAYVHS